MVKVKEEEEEEEEEDEEEEDENNVINGECEQVPEPKTTEFQATMFHVFDLETVVVEGRMVPCLAVLKLEDETEMRKFHRNRGDIDDDATVKMVKFIMGKYGGVGNSRRRRVRKTETRHMFLSHNGSRSVFF